MKALPPAFLPARGAAQSPPGGAAALASLLALTADAVAAVRSGRSLTDALARCPAELRPGVQSLSFHVLRRLGQAIAAREMLAPKAPSKPVDALLLSALALLWPDEHAPYSDHTLVDQAVTAARQRQTSSASFVNAVLRRFLRERAAVLETVQRIPSARCNHPDWWIARLQSDWPGQWQALLDANDQHPPMTLRVNARRSSVADYLQRLADAGLGGRAVGESGVVLDAPCPVQRLPGFADGDVSVQDASAQRAAPLLLGGAWLAAGARVLDACAAPGGKTAHLLECAELDVLALDHDAQRLSRVGESLGRLHLSATLRVGDAAAPEGWWDGQAFDAILLDAPCSASGIVRRHPDIRWLRRASDIAALAALQSRMLEALWPLLKSGGRLLYCTCSVFKAEGQDQIDVFLQRNIDARLAEPALSPGHLLPLADNQDGSGSAENVAPADGFFYSLLIKN